VLVPLAGRPITVVAAVLPSRANAPISGTVTIAVTGDNGVYTTRMDLPRLPLAAFTIPGNPAGRYTVTVTYSGDDHYAPSAATFPLRIR
jgi:hypothetical protein